MFAPEIVTVPAPTLVSPFAEPTDSAIRPEMTPVVDVAAPTLDVALSVTAPLIVAFAEKLIAPTAETPVPEMVTGSPELREPAPATSSVAPLATVVPLVVVPSALEWETLSVPPETVVAPE